MTSDDLASRARLAAQSAFQVRQYERGVPMAELVSDAIAAAVVALIDAGAILVPKFTPAQIAEIIKAQHPRMMADAVEQAAKRGARQEAPHGD